MITVHIDYKSAVNCPVSRKDKLAHLGYCGIAAGCGCCTAALVSHTRAESSPNSAENTAKVRQGDTAGGLIQQHRAFKRRCSRGASSVDALGLEQTECFHFILKFFLK